MRKSSESDSTDMIALVDCEDFGRKLSVQSDEVNRVGG